MKFDPDSSPRDDRLAAAPAHERLAWTATLYVLGELDDEASTAFETRLAEDQEAREAVAEAAALLGSIHAACGLEPRPAFRATAAGDVEQAGVEQAGVAHSDVGSVGRQSANWGGDGQRCRAPSAGLSLLALSLLVVSLVSATIYLGSGPGSGSGSRAGAPGSQLTRSDGPAQLPTGALGGPQSGLPAAPQQLPEQLATAWNAIRLSEQADGDVAWRELLEESSPPPSAATDELEDDAEIPPVPDWMATAVLGLARERSAGEG